MRKCDDRNDQTKQPDGEVTGGLPNKMSEESWNWKTTDPNTSGKNRHSHSFQNKSKFSSGDPKAYLKSSKSRRSFGRNLLQERSKLSKKTIPIVEEELYVKGCTAVWSRGLIQRTTLCSYTMDTPIKHALWCTFYLEWIPFVKEQFWDRNDTPIGDPLNCICLIDSDMIRAFSVTGEDFCLNLTFQISNVWSSKFGIVLEREPSSNAMVDSDSGLYSLNHPLNELRPIVIKFSASHITALNSHKTIFISTDPSIVLMYDFTTGLHCVFLYRRLRFEEWNDSKSKEHSSSLSSSQTKHDLSIFSGQGNKLFSCIYYF